MNISPKIKRFLATRLSVRFYERALFFPLYNTYFSQIKKSKSFKNREILWKEFFKENNLNKRKILYLEFGVWKGSSIKKMLEFNENNESVFIGFDTFEGLPEDWLVHLPEGHFNVGGKAPDINDKRCTFIKGLFQDTLNKVLDDIKFREYEEVVVHYDQDLYSATSYCLHELRHRIDGHYYIFDEFHVDEGRALYNYSQIYPTKIKSFGYVPDGAGYCIQVAGFLQSE